MINCPLTQNRSSEAPAEDAGKEECPAETESVVQLSRAEAKQAWLTAGGDTERAARQALRDRVTKVTACLNEMFRDTQSYSVSLLS